MLIRKSIHFAFAQPLLFSMNYEPENLSLWSCFFVKLKILKGRGKKQHRFHISELKQDLLVLGRNTTLMLMLKVTFIAGLIQYAKKDQKISFYLFFFAWSPCHMLNFLILIAEIPIFRKSLQKYFFYDLQEKEMLQQCAIFEKDKTNLIFSVLKKYQCNKLTHSFLLISLS